MMKRYRSCATRVPGLLTFLQAPLPPAKGAGARVFDPVSPDQLILRGRNRADDNAPTWQGPWRRQLGPAHKTPLLRTHRSLLRAQVHGGGYEFQGLQGAHGAPSSPLPVVSREQGSPVRLCEELPQLCSVPGP